MQILGFVLLEILLVVLVVDERIQVLVAHCGGVLVGDQSNLLAQMRGQICTARCGRGQGPSSRATVFPEGIRRAGIAASVGHETQVHRGGFFEGLDAIMQPTAFKHEIAFEVIIIDTVIGYACIAHRKPPTFGRLCKAHRRTLTRRLWRLKVLSEVIFTVVFLVFVQINAAVMAVLTRSGVQRQSTVGLAQHAFAVGAVLSTKARRHGELGDIDKWDRDFLAGLADAGAVGGCAAGSRGHRSSHNRCRPCGRSFVIFGSHKGQRLTVQVDQIGLLQGGARVGAGYLLDGGQRVASKGLPCQRPFGTVAGRTEF
mmetsp:Transcript_61999/g.109100  ORF Transcript_61999/g.109100 Transcript_61999/m.109100 type:complete len:313 (-) Transcript_61999:1938-2876(-)